MKLAGWLLAGWLLAGWPLAGQGRFDRLDRELKHAARELRITDLRAAVIESGHVVWHTGSAITAVAPEEPVIAARIAPTLLDRPASMPRGATIRQVLENRADGTPGEEVLENRAFFEALHTAGHAPNAVAFAEQRHGTLGWFIQDYAGERVAWSYSPSLLIINLPGRMLTLVVSANSKALTEAARLQDGNIARSTIALALPWRIRAR